MGKLKGLLGGLGSQGSSLLSILEYSIFGQIAGAILAPELAQVAQKFWSLTPAQQLAVADVVDAVIKGHLTVDAGIAEAKLSGINPDRFATLVAGAGEPPALDFLTEAARRKIIPVQGAGPEAVSLEAGIRESRLKDKWIPTVEAMQWHLAPVGSLIEGWLRAQITEADALALLAENGVDEKTARLMYASAGRPPSPQELLELHRRGFIPEGGEGGDTLSLRQGYLETDLKNKWYGVWLKLLEYVPPPRTVTALLRAGSITDEHALTLFQQAGLTAELAAVYVANAHHQATHAARELVKGDILNLYQEGIWTRETAAAELQTLGYSAQVAEFELEATDAHRTKALIDQAVTRLRALYTGHKISKELTQKSLDELDIPSTQRDRLLGVWELERLDNVKVLSAAEITHLAKLGVVDEAFALSMLANEGYGPADAWLRLAVGLGGLPKTPPPSDVPQPSA